MPFLRWIIGLTLPGLLLTLLGAGALWLEYRTHYVAVRLGEYLLQHNQNRTARGAVWQGILASRKSRTALANRAHSDTLGLDTIPPALLRCHYGLDRPVPNFLVLRAWGRTAPLRLDQISGREMPNLARSLQAYHLGVALLSHIQLPRAAFQVHAQIQAQIALDNGSLFDLLHRELDRVNAPEAWNFVKMSPQDQDYWQGYLGRFLAPTAARPEEFQDEDAILANACTTLLETWTDSLYAAEVDQVQRLWASGTPIQIRLVRNMDTFTGYAIVADEPPIRFSLPAAQVAAVPGMRTGHKEAP